ncbi:MAG: GntR family transcriptional regulator, partial [Anaerolineae bacterium]|nr:GntR family transcriptional regulator [Anaerolineae bacterium]
MSDSMDRVEEYIKAQGPISETDSRLLREIAYERINEAIRFSDLQTGDPLSETRLSKALGISRTPIREALQRLSRDGLLQIIPGRAVTVATPSLQEVLDVLHVRELLEPELVRLAAEELPTEGRETLLEATAAMEAAAPHDRPAWRKADVIWHQTLSNFCPNKLLGQMVLQARNRLYQRGAAENVSDEYLVKGTAEHREVVDAI